MLAPGKNPKSESPLTGRPGWAGLPLPLAVAWAGPPAQAPTGNPPAVSAAAVAGHCCPGAAGWCCHWHPVRTSRGLGGRLGPAVALGVAVGRGCGNVRLTVP